MALKNRTFVTGKPSIERTIGYCRVSLDKQADKGFSLEAQQERIRLMAALHNTPVTEFIVDAGESAKSLDRPGMTRLLDLVKRKVVGKVIIAKLDRITRSVRDLADLLELFDKYKVALVSVSENLDTQSASGRLVLNIMTAVSSWEREAIGERTASVLKYKKENGLVFNHAPYGYEAIEGKLVPVPTEQAVIGRIKELRSTGATLAAIASNLNVAGIVTKKTGIWYPSTVRNVLASSLHQ